MQEGGDAVTVYQFHVVVALGLGKGHRFSLDISQTSLAGVFLGLSLCHFAGRGGRRQPMDLLHIDDHSSSSFFSEH